MKSLLDIGKPNRVPMNLIQKEVYAYNPNLIDGVSNPIPNSTYYELLNIETEDGISQKLVEVDYPITADYVKSFEASANYKNDINGAINSGSAGKNLGDVSSLQELLSMDTSLIQEKINQINAFQQAQVQAQAQLKTKTSEVKE